MKYLVGIDEGTTGCKACLFNEVGELISSSSREYPSYYPNPGWVEQDINEIKSCVFDACKSAIINSGIDPTQIVAVSHSNQGITMVLLDENEQPARSKTIGWQDLRYVEILPELKKAVDIDEYWRISGMEFGTYNIAILNWLQKYEPDTWSRVARVCSHQDYFLRQYGADGYYIDEGSANFLSMVKLDNCEWDERLMSIYNMNRNMLPTIIHDPGKLVGQVDQKISNLTGLPIGCNVCLGGLDTNSCALGTGAKDAGTQVLIIGTAGVSLLVSDKINIDTNKRITVRSNPGFGNWQQYIMTNTGASSFRWFRDELCSLEVETGKLMGVDPYNIITSIASRSVPGANGVVALTCFQGSHTRIKNENARGIFFGINLGTKKADIAQAILESICFEMKDLILMNESISSEIKHVRLCGGVTNSDMWCQMFADILCKPIELTVLPEIGCLGAAMCAGIGSKIFSNLDDAIKQCVHIRKTFIPDAQISNVYKNIFNRWNRYYDIAVREIY